MKRDIKFNYGFLLVSLGVPLIADYFIGRNSAVILAIAITALGMLFLWAGHQHREKDDSPATNTRWRRVLTLGFASAVLGVAAILIGAVIKHKDEVVISDNRDTQADKPKGIENQPQDRPIVPSNKSKQHRHVAVPLESAEKPPQDNSVHIDNGSKLEQQSSGDCSPNIVGGSNTVTCTPLAQKTGLELSVSLVGPTAPAIIVDNQTDNVIDGIQWELVMFRTTDQASFSYVTQKIGYVKPHSKSARYLMELNTLVQAPGGGGQIANGESFVGTLAIDCPTCLGTTLIVSFVWGNTGWFYKVPDGNGRLMLPKDLSKSTVSQFIDSLNATVKPAARSPIT